MRKRKDKMMQVFFCVCVCVCVCVCLCVHQTVEEVREIQEKECAKE
jgi:hypothetical protein